MISTDKKYQLEWLTPLGIRYQDVAVRVVAERVDVLAVSCNEYSTLYVCARSGEAIGIPGCRLVDVPDDKVLDDDEHVVSSRPLFDDRGDDLGDFRRVFASWNFRNGAL